MYFSLHCIETQRTVEVRGNGDFRVSPIALIRRQRRTWRKNQNLPSLTTPQCMRLARKKCLLLCISATLLTRQPVGNRIVFRWFFGWQNSPAYFRECPRRYYFRSWFGFSSFMSRQINLSGRSVGVCHLFSKCAVV